MHKRFIATGKCLRCSDCGHPFLAVTVHALMHAKLAHADWMQSTQRTREQEPNPNDDRR